MTTLNHNKTVTLGDMVVDDLAARPPLVGDYGADNVRIGYNDGSISVEMSVVNGSTALKNSFGDIVGHHPGYLGPEYVKIYRGQERVSSIFSANQYRQNVYGLLKNAMPNMGTEVKEKKIAPDGTEHYFFSHEKERSLYYMATVGNDSVKLSVHLKVNSENDEGGIIPYMWDKLNPVLLKSIVDRVVEIMAPEANSSKKKTRRIEVHAK